MEEFGIWKSSDVSMTVADSEKRLETFPGIHTISTRIGFGEPSNSSITTQSTQEYSVYESEIEILNLTQERLKELESEVKRMRSFFKEIGVEPLNYLHISDDEAEIKIKELIRHLKEKGITDFDDFEISERLLIPIDQVDNILEKLIEEGIINEQK